MKLLRMSVSIVYITKVWIEYVTKRPQLEEEADRSRYVAYLSPVTICYLNTSCPTGMKPLQHFAKLPDQQFNLQMPDSMKPGTWYVDLCKSESCLKSSETKACQSQTLFRFVARPRQVSKLSVPAVANVILCAGRAFLIGPLFTSKERTEML